MIRYIPSSSVRVGDEIEGFGLVKAIKSGRTKNLLGGEIAIKTFTFRDGRKYNATAGWSPEDMPIVMKKLEVVDANDAPAGGEYAVSNSEAFIILTDIEKRARELVAKALEEKGEFGGYTFCAGHIGFRYPRRLWRNAKAIGFQRTADRRWIGFVHSYNGEFSAAEDAFAQALKEKKEEIASTGATRSFLDNVTLYTYLT